jgi:hypothetical protein
VKRDSAYTHIRVKDHIVAGSSVLVHGWSPTLRFHPRPAVCIIPFLVRGSKTSNYHNAVAEDIWFGWQKIERSLILREIL